MNRRVIKLGGSLLDLPDLAVRLEEWLEANPAQDNLLVVGGGPIVEAMKLLDRVHRLNQTQVHWWCIELLEYSARIVGCLLPQSLALRTPQQLAEHLHRSSQTVNPDVVLVHVSSFYSQPLSGTPGSLADLLPHSWHTTTDSLAALLCRQVEADELVLMKSTTVANPCNDAPAWCRAGIVDEAFPELAVTIPNIRIVNLRPAKDL